MLARILAITIKEALQMMRDKATLALMFLMPVIQIVLFGFAINGDPRHLPMAIEINDVSVFSRSIDSALRNTSYFDVTHVVRSRADAQRLIEHGDVQFVVTIPVDFARDLVRGKRPQLLVTADATDPSATANALGAILQAVNQGLGRDLIGPLATRQTGQMPIDLVVHRSYNPEGITSHNTVPGLLAVILSFTMVMMTAMAVTRETEQGTMENLLAMPLRPFEVMVGKITPYLVVGLVQTLVVLAFARFAFDVPFVGSFWLILATTTLFVAVSLAVGFAISTVATSQLQATQISFFYMMPGILLSGFMFPFRGMPGWAQMIGEALPMTHFLRVIRGVMLKGWDMQMAAWESGILFFMLIVLGTIAVVRYKDTVG